MSFGNDKSFADTKQFRKCVLSYTNQRLGLILKSLSDNGGVRIDPERGMLSLLDSTYKSETPSTVYGTHLKAIAFESARFLCSTNQVVGDIIFDTTRGEYLSQNIASFLFPDRRFAQTEDNDNKVRNFYMSVVEAYFGGSTKANIEKSLFKFTGIPVNIIENYLSTQEGLDAVVKQFTFDVSVDIEDQRIKDINKLNADIELLLNIIKPAHTVYKSKFILAENLDTFRHDCLLVKDLNGDPLITHDGFETKIKLNPTSICDTIHLDYYDYKYEDIRKSCVKVFAIAVDGEIIGEQASPRVSPSIKGGNWSVVDESTFHTRFGPFGKPTGAIADLPTDIKVYVNAVPVTVIKIYPLSSAFQLASIPPAGSVITIDYYFLKDYTGALITNDFDSVINNYKNQATEISYKTVLFPSDYSTTQKIPLVTDYKYKGFDFFYSSILNCPETLLFNEQGVRNKLNDALVFKSEKYDLDFYTTSLNETTPIVPLSLDKKSAWRRLPFQEFRMNNDEFIMNVHEDRLYGEIHYESYNSFYSALEIQTRDNGGETSLLTPFCEDTTYGMSLEFAILNNETVEHLGKEYETSFYTYPNMTLASGYTPLNSTEFVLLWGGASWDFTSYTSSIDFSATAHFGGNVGQGHFLLNDITSESYSATALVTENWDHLWARDISENTYYQDRILSYGLDPYPVSGYGMDDRGYLFHLFENIDVNQNLNYPTSDIYPIHLDDLTREIYSDSPCFSVGDLTSLTNSPSGNTLCGVKLKESDIGIIPTYESYTVSGFMMNSYDVMSSKVISIKDNYDSSFILNHSLIFLVLSGRILSNNLIKVTNMTKGLDYDLTGVIITSERVIDINETLPINLGIGYDEGDQITADFIGIDRLDVSDELVSVMSPNGDASGMQFISYRELISVSEVENVTRAGFYDLTGDFVQGSLIDVDETIPLNNVLGLGVDDNVFATFTTAEEQRPEHVFNYPVTRNIIVNYDIGPI